jgi:hypothetical protein
MTKVISTACTLLLYNCVAIDAATVTRYGVSIDYDPAFFSEVFCNESPRTPRTRNHVPKPEDHFTPGELTFVLKSPSKIGSAIVTLTPTTHRNAEYFNQAYPDIAARIRTLKDLLRKHRALPQIDENRRPIHPIWQHLVYLISKVSYFDFPWGSAIGLLEFDDQTFGHAAGYDAQFGWSRLDYAMYGLTADERFYVSGNLDVVHPELERRENKRLGSRSFGDPEYYAYLERATRLTERRPDESFSPSLTVLQQLIGSIKIDATQARPEKWHRLRDRRKITIDAE